VSASMFEKALDKSSHRVKVAEELEKSRISLSSLRVMVSCKTFEVPPITSYSIIFKAYA